MVDSNFFITNKNFSAAPCVECCAIPSFNPILIMLVLPGIQILIENIERKFKLHKINVFGFVCFREIECKLGVNEIRKINWLPTRERFEQCINVPRGIQDL